MTGGLGRRNIEARDRQRGRRYHARRGGVDRAPGARVDQLRHRRGREGLHSQRRPVGVDNLHDRDDLGYDAGQVLGGGAAVDLSVQTSVLVPGRPGFVRVTMLLGCAGLKE